MRGQVRSRAARWTAEVQLLYPLMRRAILSIACYQLVLGMFSLGISQAQSTWRTDSLMATWPVQQAIQQAGPSGRGVVRAVDTKGLYTKLQREAPGIPVFADSNVVLYADLYGEPLREHFRVLRGVSLVYLPMIEKELALQGLPNELKFLPMAMSAMNVQAGSATGGAGLWMLSYPVAVKYGLRVTAEVDERHDDVKSTMAAGRYLKDLYARYTDQGLAIMAFACGPANVTRAQQRTGGATDYRSLYPHFSDGLREVLPLLMAFIHLEAQATLLGLDPIEVNLWEPTDTELAPRPTQLRTIAKVLQLPLGKLLALNPTLSAGMVPQGHAFLLPQGEGPKFRQLTDSLQRMELAPVNAQNQTGPSAADETITVDVQKTIRYRVRAGDNLGSIAERHRVSIKQLRLWNNLRSDRINAGQVLVINVKERKVIKPSSEPEQQLPEDEGPTNSTGRPPVAGAKEVGVVLPGQRITLYTVQSGDSLYRIAMRFPGVTAQLIMDANGIGTAIKPGQKLTIPQP